MFEMIAASGTLNWVERWYRNIFLKKMNELVCIGPECKILELLHKIIIASY